MALRICRFWLLALALAWTPWVLAAAAGGQVAGSPWSALSAPQREALAPLAAEWDQMPSDNRKKWLEVAARFPAMPQKQQLRIQERMTDWSRMTPQQRGDARVNFQQSKALKLQDRQAKWEAYLALTKDERDALADKARTASEAAPPKVQGASTALRAAPVGAQSPKSNLVPAASASADAPRAVSPSLVQGSTGATTSLVTSRPVPPAHQPTGQPKIATSSSGVDRVTLLPKPPGQPTLPTTPPSHLPATPLAVSTPASAAVLNP